ncbi:ATP-binding cassette domain-containing protein [Nakamurella lactea]|uniref:ATP-binding cassette domain-containing protein n=1 Tax=Nakamurella lactea TaxID=459515 RepID=UPI0003FDDD38|nr:sugar ABC transporter ATP-binding protein [Nakamurella lactea]
MLIELQGVSVAYPGTLALDQVSMEISAGEVVAVVGANGSGKTTLLSTLCGIRRPTAGHLVLGGQQVRFTRPAQALAHGIAMVPQEPQIADSLPVWENVLLGTIGLIDRAPGRTAQAAAKRTVAQGLPHVDPNQPAGELRKADRAILGLLRAMHRRPSVLALDEPTAVLGENSVQVVDAAARAVRESGGATVLVSHRLRDIVQLASRVVVLVDGRLVHDAPIGAVSVEDLIDRIASGRMAAGAADAGKQSTSGRSPIADRANTAAPRSNSTRTDSILELRDIVSAHGLTIDQLEIRPGQILGVAGLAGAGRSRLCRTIAGHAPYRGEITLVGQRLPRGARNRWRAGIAYLPEDRSREAVFDSLSVARNLEIGELPRAALTGWFAPNPDRGRTRTLIERFGIRTPAAGAPITALSGGNQQRVVLARVLSHQPQALIADEPTQGVDAAGRAAIHRMIRQFAAEGGAVLLVSSEFEELQALSTDIVVMVDGSIVAHRPPDVAYRDLLALATGVHVGTPVHPDGNTAAQGAN